jgi:hypothetical protein
MGSDDRTQKEQHWSSTTRSRRVGYIVSAQVMNRSEHSAAGLSAYSSCDTCRDVTQDTEGLLIMAAWRCKTHADD